MDNNYMKTILSGIKEWTENLTDDAVDKANNALDKANNALDKALFVVNITTTDGETFSADKTFEEIVQAYNEKKYNIVVDAGDLIVPFVNIEESTGFQAKFSGTISNRVVTIIITDNNEIKYSVLLLATAKFKLPNPYPLTFTGAVNETYDGSSKKTIEIPSGGGEVIIASSTAGSTKKFKITVDDSGTITATEVV